jgi:hypothetical protein
MEVIRIKTIGKFQLTAYKDKIQFIVLEDLLNALQVEFIEDVIKYIKEDQHWWTSVKQMDLPEVGTKDVIQITHALGLIYWLPLGMVQFLHKWEVYTALSVHLEMYLEFFQWQLKEVSRITGNIEKANAEMDKQNHIIIENQALIIEELKKALNI